MLPIGIDLGNGAVKVVFGQTRLLIPNVIADGMGRPDIGETPKALQALDVSVKSSLVDGEQRYFVGHLASFQSSRAKYMSPSEQKSTSKQSGLLYVTALAAAVLQQRKELGEDISGVIHADLFAVSGISLVEALHSGIRTEFEERLTGTHHVSFFPPSEWAGVEVVLHVKAKVMPEGYAAYLWLARNIPSVQQAKDSMIGMAEIGELSTEFPVFQAFTLNPNLCSGEQFGTGQVIDDLLVQIRQFTKLPTAFPSGRLELEKFLESPKRQVSLMGKVVDLTEVVNQRLDMEATRLYSKIIEKWEHCPGIEQFWVVGGGAALFQPYLKSLAAKDGRMLHFAPDPSLSRWMNAEGMDFLARETVKSMAVVS